MTLQLQLGAHDSRNRETRKKRSIHANININIVFVLIFMTNCVLRVGAEVLLTVVDEVCYDIIIYIYIIIIIWPNNIIILIIIIIYIFNITLYNNNRAFSVWLGTLWRAQVRDFNAEFAGVAL